jgi:hypothetical protein
MPKNTHSSGNPASQHPQKLVAVASSGTIILLLILGMTAISVGPSFAVQGAMRKEHTMKMQTLMYAAMTFAAPNTPEFPYQVISKKQGKTVWHIDDGAKETKTINGGIEKLEIKKVAESELDSGAENYKEMKQYVGKPALYIYYRKETVVNRLPSWKIVDINTGKQIAFIAFN